MSGPERRGPSMLGLDRRERAIERGARLVGAAQLEQGQAMQAGELDVLRRCRARARRQRLGAGRVSAVEQTGQLVMEGEEFGS